MACSARVCACGMGKKEKRHIGSVGVYVFVPGEDSTKWRVLLHRRSAKVDNSHTLSAPGGLIKKEVCFTEEGNYDPEVGAWQSAVRELCEETGVDLGGFGPEDFFDLAVSPDHTSFHKNLGIIFPEAPRIPGPGRDWRHEIQQHGCDGVGILCGDTYHTWGDVSEILDRTDVMCFCREPLASFLKMQTDVCMGHSQFLPDSQSSLMTPRVCAPGGSEGSHVHAVFLSNRSVEEVQAMENVGSPCMWPSVESLLPPPVAEAHVRRPIQSPATAKPYDVLRAEAGRLVAQTKTYKKPITGDRSKSWTWHATEGEQMVRTWAADRGLEKLLGECSSHVDQNIHFLSFEYLQPACLVGTPWEWATNASADECMLVHHGTYWECAPAIMGSGRLSPSNADASYGEREYHKTQGCYTSDEPQQVYGHYAWPSNVFENNCFYGIGFMLVALKKTASEVFPSAKQQYNTRICMASHCIGDSEGCSDFE